MSRFTGVGDAATKVIANQNQLGMQAAQLSENARQFDASQEEAEKQRTENTRQFDATAERADASAAENTRQFEKTGEQKQAVLKEGARQYDLTRADGLSQQERQAAIEELTLSLNALTTESNLANQDANTQVLRANLAQYMAVTEREQQQRQNRDKLLRGGFLGATLSSISNGGVGTVAGGNLLLQQLGIKKGRAQYFTDMETGDTYFDILNEDTGEQIQKMIPAALAVAVMREDHGDDFADSFAKVWMGNKAVMSKIEMEKAKRAAEMEKTKRAAETESKRVLQHDPMQAASFYAKRAADKREAAVKLVGREDRQTALLEEAAADDAAADRYLQGSGGAAKDKPFTPERTFVNDTERKAYGIPPDYDAETLPKGFTLLNGMTLEKGGMVVRFFDSDGSYQERYIEDAE